MSSKKVKSYAKINLVLRVLGKRADHYHELYTIMQEISLCDILKFKTGRPGVRLHTTSSNIPSDERNLIVKACSAFQKSTGAVLNFDISVEKNIPVSAGLGGGSSNAACTLVFLNEFFGNPLSDPELIRISAEIGSDVPFFITGGMALAEGRGEQITSISPLPAIDILLINNGTPVSTQHIYQKLNKGLTMVPPPPKIRSAFAGSKQWSDSLFSLIGNDLEEPLFTLYPEIRELKRWMLDNRANAVAVSGSGGTVFGLFADSGAALDAADKARRTFQWSMIEKTVDVEAMNYWGVGKR